MRSKLSAYILLFVCGLVASSVGECTLREYAHSYPVNRYTASAPVIRKPSRSNAPIPIRDIGGSLSVEGDTTLVVNKLPFNVVSPILNADFYLWQVPNGWVATEDGKGRLTVTAAPDGKATVVCGGFKTDWEAKKNNPFSFSLTLIVGKSVTPQPSPPGPNPPNPSTSLRVMMIFPNNKVLPKEQQSVLDGEKVRNYLEEKCGVGEDKLKEYRIWPDNVLDKMPPAQLERLSKVWKDLLSRPKASVPWIVIQSQKGTYEGPLPSNPDQAIALLNKYSN